MLSITQYLCWQETCFFDDPEDAQIEGDDEEVVYQGPLNDGKTTRNHLIRQRFV